MAMPVMISTRSEGHRDPSSKFEPSREGRGRRPWTLDLGSQPCAYSGYIAGLQVHTTAYNGPLDLYMSPGCRETR